MPTVTDQLKPHPLCSRLRRLVSRFRRDRSGSAAIEFAIVAPMFFFLMFVIAETAMVFIAEQVMDNAVADSARLIRTGQAQKASMSEADFRSNVCGKMRVFINCNSSNFYLEVKSYANFSDMQVTKPIKSDQTFRDQPAFDFGDQGEIVVVRAYYQWPINPIFGGLKIKNNMTNGKQMIGSFAAFRNEPFGPTT